MIQHDLFGVLSAKSTGFVPRRWVGWISTSVCLTVYWSFESADVEPQGVRAAHGKI